MARFIAKNIVASGLAKKCEVQIAYAIGVADPVSVMANTFGTGIYDDETISKTVSSVFNLRPYSIVKTLDLLKPIYARTSNYGHFGRTEDGFTWEQTVKIAELKETAKELNRATVTV